MENGKELEVTGQEEKPLAIADGLLNEEAIRRAEMMVDGINKIKAISIKVTNYADWSLQNGKPYLENSGCMKIGNLWGVNFKDRKFTPEGGERMMDANGEYILFTVSGRAEFKGRIVEDIGTCSTRDDFFGTRKDAEGEKKFKPIEDVDLENIKKKAVTNLQGRLLKKILGLNYTIEDLTASGIEIGKMGKIAYASGGAGGGRVSQPQANRLWAILQNGSSTPEEKKSREESLKKFLKEKHGIESSKDISTKDYEAICKWAMDYAASVTVGA